jgi:hypothetical protein
VNSGNILRKNTVNLATRKKLHSQIMIIAPNKSISKIVFFSTLSNT